MIKFLIKGVLRDKQRSLFPIMIVAIGVLLTVLMQCWLSGVLGDMIDYNARFATGHVKIMSNAYAERADQIPNDLALEGVDELITNLTNDYPDIDWVKRIRFGGLLDAPDESGETKEQGPAFGMAIDLLYEKSNEINRIGIKEAIVKGKIPQKRGEILISDDFANKLDINPGDAVTFLGSTMYGSMAWQNFIISGTVRFGVSAMDRGFIFVDLKDAQAVLDMQNAAGEILGYFDTEIYNDQRAETIKTEFNNKNYNKHNRFSPVMLKLIEQNDLASMFEYMSTMITFFIVIFVSAMSIVLWNTGLLGGLRRYGEIGVRLAIGEYKGHVYRSMIIESVFIGIIGSVVGTLIGLGIGYYLQNHGLDFGKYFKNATILFPNKFRTHVTPAAYYIGFIPGLFSTVLGTVLSGIGIYKRKTAQLFKELET